ncbi:FUSC family protein [Roseomonas fluvialis]|uniref:Fusaric acid resistance protein n=1 Tax=Roseomonas fluvialis TaxID=1750527 RepID=A0ABM7Y6G0_9PROT|nr:FUSC family protein [Roseomonas fluvialis]BDG73508.1 fusaric acid resistance protein [Roseomonas fluvialis]
MSASAAAQDTFTARLRADLAPFPGRAALTWRIALLCAIVCATAMMYEIPEAAISCYLIIFLMKPDAVQNIGTALGLILLVTIVVLCVVPLINATIASPLLRLLAIAVVSFVFLFIGAASQLGEIGGIIALVIAFVLTLLSLAPVGDAVSFGLRYAWYMAVMPMALMAVFNMVLGMSSVRLLRDTLRRRLATTMDAIASGAPDGHDALAELLRADNAALEQQARLVGILALVGRPAAGQVTRDVRASYRLMLAASALPGDLDAVRRDALIDAIRQALDALDGGRMPAPPATPAGPMGDAERDLLAALRIIAGAPEDPVVAPPKPPFFAPDALANPSYQRYALKTTAAAILCYVIYVGIDWQGIHTAMVTCYVAALGTTGETVHKLGLRILGCLIGAAMGMAAILFVVPHIDDIGGLMVLVFAGVLIGAWVSTGPERISYGGVQICLAFLLTVLQGFGPSLDLGTGRDRVIGILLGNLVVFVIFTQIWPTPIAHAVRAHLQAAFAGLARLAALPPERRVGAIPEAALAITEAAKAAEALDLVAFEPANIRPTAAAEADLRDAASEIAALTRDIYLSREALPDVAARLEDLAARTAQGESLVMAQAGGSADPLRRRLDRLRIAMAG